MKRIMCTLLLLAMLGVTACSAGTPAQSAGSEKPTEMSSGSENSAEMPAQPAGGEKILDMVFEKGYTEANKELSDVLLDFATRTRENMSLNKVQIIEVPEGASSGIYVHSNFKQAAVVIVKGSTDDKVKEFAKDCCMHLVAFTPAYIKQTDVPQSYIDEQKDIFKKQMEQDPKMASKPENVREGILQGKINKHLAEVCFVDQMFVKDDKKSVNAKLAEIGKEVGASLEFGDISLLVLGK